jgi:thiol-disulfide isomerase/thioredoxin
MPESDDPSRGGHALIHAWSLSMTRVLLGSMVLTSSILFLGCNPPSMVVQDPVAKKGAAGGDEPSPKTAVQKALEVGDHEPDKAISILETALKTAPKDREVLLLLAVISVVEGEKATDDKVKRIARFHKAFATFGDLKRSHEKLNSPEKSFEVRIELGEARALALEGKTAESFGIIKGLMAPGNGDLDSIETVDDLRTLQDLPEFRTLLDSSYAPRLAEAKKEVEAELAAFKPFAFDFKLKDLDDKTVSLADYRGKLTIVDLWGTWCPPCRREIPHFVALSKKYKDQGLEIVGINCNEVGTEDEIKKTIREFAKAYKIDYKCLLSDDSVQDRVPGFQGFPTTLFIDPSGKVRLVFFQAEPKAKLEAAIATLLTEGPRAP